MNRALPSGFGPVLRKPGAQRLGRVRADVLTHADIFGFCWLLLAFAGFCLVPPARAMVTDRAVVERYEWAQLRL